MVDATRSAIVVAMMSAMLGCGTAPPSTSESSSEGKRPDDSSHSQSPQDSGSLNQQSTVPVSGQSGAPNMIGD